MMVKSSIYFLMVQRSSSVHDGSKVMAIKLATQPGCTSGSVYIIR